MHTQKLLAKVGDQGKFQIYSIIFVCAKWLIISLSIFLPSYLFITPSFTCGSELKVNENDACPRIEHCTIDQVHTITNYAGLYCENRFVRNSIVSAEFVGSVVGLILLSILADKLGRKIIIVSTLCFSLMGTMLLTLGTHYKIFPLMYIGIIMMGFGGYSLSMVSYSYLSEINSDIWRQRSLIMTYSFWALGEIMLFPIIRYVENWLQICFFILIIPLFILLLMTCLVVEPPEFLYSQKRYAECLDSLNQIAAFNGQPALTDLRIEGQPQKQQQQTEQIQHAFRKMKYLLPLIILSFAQVCNNGFYYTIQYSLDDYGYSFEVNMLVIGCLEFMSCFFTNFFCHKMKRKMWIVILMILSGILGVCVEFSKTEIADLVLIGFSRLFNTVGFALFSLITSETFPTEIRSTGLGVSEAMSNLGNMGAPFLVTLAQISGVKAVFVGGFMNLIGGVSMLLVKETKLDKVSASQKTESLLDSQKQV